MTLAPYGDDRLGDHLLLTGSIWTTANAAGEPAHGYRLAVVNAAGPGHVVSGSVPKAVSGHRNPLHLLAAVAADVDFQVLGSDYAVTMLDLPADDPRRREDRRRHIDDVASVAIDAIRSLAAAGGDGAEALRRIEAAVADARAGRLAPSSGLVSDLDTINSIVDAL
ncbi:hypothetical protein [Azospirillum argentinense]|uniref:Uncharacterized protein n=1 Tax=Azospirillum brasilense TaxID=192 RepID=A0A4D8QF03_AZOBR|nr:hypothetical protein [Azospirillum argentinense]QCO07486.1 hypothetical protein D3867_37005 [Azospirillum argentinense]